MVFLRPFSFGADPYKPHPVTAGSAMRCVPLFDDGLPLVSLDAMSGAQRKQRPAENGRRLGRSPGKEAGKSTQILFKLEA